MNPHDRTFEDFELGDVLSFTRCFALKDFRPFSRISGDTNLIHENDEYAAKSGHSQAIMPLLMAAAPLSSVVGNGFGQYRSLILNVSLRAVQPIFYDQDITYSA